jgi:hypothetical protein
VFKWKVQTSLLPLTGHFFNGGVKMEGTAFETRDINPGG